MKRELFHVISEIPQLRGVLSGTRQFCHKLDSTGALLNCDAKGMTRKQFELFGWRTVSSKYLQAKAET